MGFLKRLALLILFFPILFVSLLQIVGHLFMWLVSGENIFEKEILYEKIYFK